MTAGFPLAATTSDNWVAMSIWGAVILAAIALLGMGVLWVRKYALQSMKGVDASRDELTIERLEEMYRSGQISREEFSTLRRAALGLGPAGAGKGPPPAAPGQPGPSAEKPRGGEEPSSPDPGLTDRPPDVDENRKNQPPGTPPAQP
jgi:hypothetical protein